MFVGLAEPQSFSKFESIYTAIGYFLAIKRLALPPIAT